MPIFIFLHYKSMTTISCHNNQSSYPIGTKNNFNRPPPPPAYRCYMWNMARIGFLASEKMSFENVDGRRMPAYTISSHMSLRLRWAKTQEKIDPMLLLGTVLRVSLNTTVNGLPNWSSARWFVLSFVPVFQDLLFCRVLNFNLITALVLIFMLSMNKMRVKIKIFLIVPSRFFCCSWLSSVNLLIVLRRLVLIRVKEYCPLGCLQYCLILVPSIGFSISYSIDSPARGVHVPVPLFNWNKSLCSPAPQTQKLEFLRNLPKWHLLPCPPHA